MAVNLETIVKQLTESSLIAPGKLENFVPPKAQPKNAEELIAELVKSGNLTRFQAIQVKAGKARSLLLGGYTILDRIGAGGMGQVFKAQHRKMERLVAIKMLPPAMTKDAAALARFQREVVAAAKLRHPNIVAADDAAEANGVHFLVMEYMDGKDLSALVKKDGPLPVNKAVNYILQAARGLEFAHSKGVIHRDIKPANLLLGNDGVVKILDMGLARFEQADGGAQAELTGSGTIMGTVDYMSPEQALNTKSADARADIYSLGISLYYLLAGKAAYGGDTAMEKLMAHQTQPIPSLQEVQAAVPKQLDEIFQQMVAKCVTDRYQSMTEVIEDLQALGLGGSSSNVSHDRASAMSLSTAERKKLGKQLTGKSVLTKVVTSEKSKNFLAKVIGGTFVTIVAPILVTFLIKYLDKSDAPPAAPSPGPTSASPVESASPGTAPTTVASSANTSAPAVATPMPAVASLNKPQFQQWVADTQKLPAEEQIKAVSKKLKELNVLFDGKLDNLENTPGGPRIVAGVVQEVGIETDKVDDLSPLRGFPGIEYLKISGNRRPNLSSLQGLPLKTLHFNRSGGDGRWLQTSDLSALRQCPNLRLVRVQGMSFTAGSWATFTKSLPPNCNYEKVSGDTPASSGAESPNPWETPEFQKWVADTQKLPNEEQWKAVVQKLKELNPGYDGKTVGSYAREGPPVIKDGAIFEFGIKSDDVTDISPFRALPEMPNLILLSAGKKTVAPDPAYLEPLRGLPIGQVWCTGNKRVIDLAPLADCAKLRRVRAATTSVTAETVNALKKALPNCTIEWDGAKTTEPEATIQPAARPWETPEFQRWIADTQKLSTAKQLDEVSKKLMELNPGFDGKLADYIGQEVPKVEGGKVIEVGFHTNNVSDISPVRVFTRLKTLRCTTIKGKGLVSDLTPLIGIPLTKLNIYNNPPISDLSPLKEMQLTTLGCGGTGVNDLSLLVGMPLVELHLQNSPVADLTPLREMPLTTLTITGTKVTDLSPLRECKSLSTLAATKLKLAPADIAELEAALPNCKIDWDRPKTPAQAPAAKP